MKNKIKIVSVLLGLSFLVLPLASLAVADPVLSMAVHGTITSEGSNMAVGTVLRAYCGNTTTEIGETTLAVAGEYGTQNTSLPVNDCASGTTIYVQATSGSSITEKRATDFAFTAAEIRTYNIAFTGATTTISVPTDLSTIVISTSQIDLSWTAVDGAVSYKVYRDGANVGSPTSNSYSDTGLSSNTTYSYTVLAVDADAGETSQCSVVSATTNSVAGGGGGGGGGGSAIQPPQISGIKVVKTTTTAIITWTTNKSATSKVNYGLTKSYGETISSSDLVTSHSLLLTGLSISTTYNYQIKSKDSGGRTGTYSNRTFTTLSGIGEQEEEEEDMTIAQLKAAIADILAQIKLLQVELNKLLGVSVEGCTITSFDRSLKIGMTGDDVKCLQIILNSASDTRVAASGVGSAGNETQYFGSLTKAGVIKFQNKYASDILAAWNLTEGTGYVGSTTLDKLNSLLGQ